MKRKILIYLTTASLFEEYSNMIACDLLEKIGGEVLFYHTLAIWSQDKFGMITLILCLLVALRTCSMLIFECICT